MVGHGWLDPVKPTEEVAVARGGKGGAGDLLGVETVGADERAVLPHRQSSGKSFGGMVVSEARKVAEIVSGDWVVHDSRNSQRKMEWRSEVE